MTDAKQDLQLTATTIRDAVTALRAVRPTMEQFLRECRDMDNFGAVLRPELFMDPRRRRLSDAIKPLAEAAILLIEAHNAASQSMIEGVIADKMAAEQ